MSTPPNSSSTTSSTTSFTTSSTASANVPAEQPAFEVVMTRAGHRAVLDHRTGEVMHPTVSPVCEPEQLYIGPSRLRSRLLEESSHPLCLFDVGLGAGGTARAAIKTASALGAQARPLHIISFDRTVEALALSCSDAHAEAFGFDTALRSAVQELLAHGEVVLPWGRWQLQVGELPATLVSAGRASLAEAVFWDAFSPRRNAELWSVAAFTALKQVCKPHATVHTYSGATAVRSALLLAGFYVGLGEVLSGKKRATEAAIRPADVRELLPPEFLGRLSRSSAAFPADAPRDPLQTLCQHPQFARAKPRQI